MSSLSGNPLVAKFSPKWFWLAQIKLKWKLITKTSEAEWWEFIEPTWRSHARDRPFRWLTSIQLLFGWRKAEWMLWKWTYCSGYWISSFCKATKLWVGPWGHLKKTLHVSSSPIQIVIRHPPPFRKLSYNNNNRDIKHASSLVLPLPPLSLPLVSSSYNLGFLIFP